MEARKKKEEAAVRRKAEREEAAARKREEHEAKKARRARVKEAGATQRGASGSGVVVAPVPAPITVRPERPTDLPPVGPSDIERLRTAVRDEPEDSRSWWTLAAALRAGGREAEAASAERRAARLPPPATGPAASRAYSPPAADEAVALEQTLRQQARELIREGDKLFSVQRFADALAAYRQAAEADEGSAEAEYKAGLAAAELGRNGDASAAFERALQRDPSHAQARERLDRLRR